MAGTAGATNDEDDDCQFEYVAPLTAQTKGGASGDARQLSKTAYEEERDARVRAIVSQQGLALPPPSEAVSPCGTEEKGEVEDTLAQRQDPEERQSTKPALNPTEEAQRLKNQRYAIYRRNRYLNQNALREVDPGTKRYMQIVYTPSNAVGRQYHTMRRGGHTGPLAGGQQFTPRGQSGFKRSRD
ncbi:hypothetical protein TraAM80_08735 [Trypanosoma rangeli]|uniref:Uncharacterized protein n=1 Tax=Trypanosoma rangeli TaxID=5698 RepID=A0A3R7K0J6_TRYRA|nr:uncharacterized protein TraAM80_08735 [Trypanosoma rangeli]RNE98484.1 hypothetical protein TraAM80_08735 [Trypanosoma rangeli]|eukprot:RNE98484.1 hypothetical protein TraAM80_08735 [Trypanosoma rangeli]